MFFLGFCVVLGCSYDYSFWCFTLFKRLTGKIFVPKLIYYASIETLYILFNSAMDIC